MTGSSAGTVAMPSWSTAGKSRRIGMRSTTSKLRSRKCWPYRYEELEVELHRVGLRTDVSTFDLEAENYMVVASKV